MTNYTLAKLINFKLSQEGLNEVRPQQIYNVRKGLRELDGKDALEFIESYVNTRKNGRTVRSIDPAEWFAANS